MLLIAIRSLLFAALCFVMICSLPEAFAQGATPPPPSMGEYLLRMLPMFVAVYLVFHFLVMKPQKKKLDDQRQLLSSLKKGENIITSSGIVGRIAGTEGEFVLLEIASGVRIKVEASHVARRLESASASGKGTEKSAA